TPTKAVKRPTVVRSSDSGRRWYLRLPIRPSKNGGDSCACTTPTADCSWRAVLTSSFLANGSHQIPRTRSQCAKRSTLNALYGECHKLKRKCVACWKTKVTTQTLRCDPSKATSRYDHPEQNCPA